MMMLTYSLINHFNHLAVTIFARPELDMAERQLGHAYNVDCDLDNFAAAVVFARQAIASLEGDDGKWCLVVGRLSDWATELSMACSTL
jgi:hypothetical protein